MRVLRDYALQLFESVGMINTKIPQIHLDRVEEAAVELDTVCRVRVLLTKVEIGRWQSDVVHLARQQGKKAPILALDVF